MRFAALLIAGVLCLPAWARFTPEQTRRNLESFDYVWRTIREKHWSMPPAADWDRAAEELRPRVENAEDMDAVRKAMHDLISRLKQSHFNIVPGDVYETFGHSADPGTSPEGQPGFDVREIDGEIVVVSVEQGSPAAQAGVRPGWVVRKVGSTDVRAQLARVLTAVEEPTSRGLILRRAAMSQMKGPVDSTIRIQFLDGNNKPVAAGIRLIPPRGNPARFGYLAGLNVWFEWSKTDNIGYTRWNVFMDPVNVMAEFAAAVRKCTGCDGLIIDLRGNPGGIGVMAMGIAGWLISEPDQKLGGMKTKDTEVKFVVIPRPEAYKGPVAVLVDESTASTSEIFAGGMKDLGRARIFGSRTAGAALPSVFEKLPNGDGFQYAVANYTSESGRPPEALK
jgi:carboxyl-terminal processing protease